MSQRRKNIEAIYPLSPLQQGLLFHAVADVGSGNYINQVNLTLPDLQVDLFKQAWQKVVNRHAALRTLFLWENRSQPLQIVRRKVELVWDEHDWRTLAQSEQQTRLATLMDEARREDFALNEAPLMRFTLVQRGETSHEFVWTYHHLITDGWSTSLIFKEVFGLYEAMKRGDSFPLATPQPFRTYISWLQRQDRAAAESFWRRYLQGYSQPTPLMVDKQATARTSDQASHREQGFLLPADVLAELQHKAHEHQLTLNTLFMAGWGLLLSRYSGEADVLFGTVVSGRPPTLSGVESMVGLFINTLPLRVQVEEEIRLDTWLQQLQAQQSEREGYGYVSLLDIQKWSDIPQGSELFESAAAFENYPIDDALVDKADRLEHGYISQTHIPLELIILLEAKTTFTLGYTTNRFDAETIQRIGSHYLTILQSMATSLTQRLGDVAMLTADERHQLLREWNDTATDYLDYLDYPRSKPIHQLFSEQAERTPDAIAALFDPSTLTYAELNTRANQLARYLQTLGVGPETLVGLCVERSVEMIVAMLAILKAGGAYVPLESDYPTERLAFMLADTAVPVVLTQSELRDTIPATPAKIVCLDTIEEVLATYSPDNLETPIEGTNLAYVIYTSGSTGQPKGVAVPHQAVNRLVKKTNYIQITPADRIGQASNAAFDAATFEIWGALLNGAQLVGINREEVLSPQKLVNKLQAEQISVLFLTTALFNQVVNLIPDAFQSLRCLLFGGEAVDPNAVRKVLQHGRPADFLHVYGPTENTTYSSWYPIEAVADDATTVPIGKPIANSQIYLLDQSMRPVPIGVAGELHVGGDGLALGYLNRPQLTAERFVENPFGAGRLYKTGDYARYLLSFDADQGHIEFIGRIDNQIKLRGFRIELGEIESALSQHPDIYEVVVLLNQEPDNEGIVNKRLVAYLVAAHTLKISELRTGLQDKLPDYMIPAAFVLLDAMPLTANGKIDRRALATLEQMKITDAHSESFLAPTTSIESTLADIWQNVLKVEQIGIHDNFFELGGDSILSIQVVSRARKAGLYLTARDVLQQMTIAQLAHLLENQENQESQVENSGVDGKSIAQPAQDVITGTLPLTPIQHWFFAQNLAAPEHHNQLSWLKVSASVKPALLRQVVKTLIAHHDALRLRYKRRSAGWQQTNAAPDDEVPFEVYDLSALSSVAQPEAMVAKTTELQASLNLTDGPLLRVALFQLGERQAARLFFLIHHLAVDGVSWRILLEDLESAYQQLSTGQPLQLPAKTTSFKAWAHWLNEQGVESVAKQAETWSTLLPATVLPLPLDFSAGENTYASSEKVRMNLSQGQTSALLQEAPSAYHTQVNDLLLTALVQTVAQWTNSPSLLVDLEGHGREELSADLDLSRTVGWFTSIYPVYLSLEQVAHQTHLGEAIKSIKEQLRQIPENGIGYGILRYLKRLASLSASQSEPQISFNYMGQFDQVQQDGIIIGPASEPCGAEISPLNPRTHLLNVSGIVVDGQLEIVWTYSTNRHHRSTIERLAATYIDSLTALINHCLSPETGGYTPSDFPHVNLDQSALDNALAEIALENIVS